MVGGSFRGRSDSIPVTSDKGTVLLLHKDSDDECAVLLSRNAVLLSHKAVLLSRKAVLLSRKAGRPPSVCSTKPLDRLLSSLTISSTTSLI